MNYELIIAVVLGIFVGWVAARIYTRNIPSERALVFKAAAAVSKRLAALQSTAPEEMAAIAAEEAREAALLKAFQEQVASLK